MNKCGSKNIEWKNAICDFLAKSRENYDSNQCWQLVCDQIRYPNLAKRLSERLISLAGVPA